ncbi:MAG: Cna B-type domain-containing protein [Porcipelethomonas sp.]
MRDYEFNESTIIKKHKNNQRYIIVLILLSVMVAAIVGISLIEPAESMTYTCGMEEHIHSDDCYSLACTENVLPHSHTAECYPDGDISLEPTCGIGEGAVSHVHTADCYGLACGMPEHIHGADCQTSGAASEEPSEEPSETDIPEVTEPVSETAVSEDITTADTEISVSETTVTSVSSTVLTVEKVSYDQETDELSWTLIFSHDGTDLDGYEISDDKLIKNITKLEVYDETDTLLDTFDDENLSGEETWGTLGTLTKSEGKFSFAPGQCGTKYKFVYTIKAEKNFVRGIELINKTILMVNGIETEVSEDTFIIPIQMALGASDKFTIAAAALTVANDSSVYVSDTDCILNWTVSVTADAGEFNGKYLRNTSANHYITPSQRSGLRLEAFDSGGNAVTLLKDTDYTITLQDLYGNTISDSDTSTNAYKFVIQFNDTAAVSNVSKVNAVFSSLTVVSAGIEDTAEFYRKESETEVVDATCTAYAVLPTEKTSLISKTAPDDFPNDNYMPYELDINPSGNKINSGNDIIVEDKFDTVSSGVVPVRNTMEVYKVGVDGSETLLTDADYQYTYSGSGSTLSFKFTLKDSTHYKIKYKYHIIFTQDFTDSGYGSNLNLKNTAKLTYGSYSQSASCDKNYSVTRAKTSWSPSIENVDATDHSIKLENGIFNLYKYDYSSSLWVPLTNADCMTDSSNNTVLSNHTWGTSESDVPLGFASGSSGRIALGSLDSGYIYKLIQTASKEGYSFPKTPYYFADYISSGNYNWDGSSKSGLLDGSVQILSENDSIIVENRVIEATEISVNKIWRDNLQVHNDLPVNLKLHQSAISPDGSISGGQKITVHFLAYQKDSGRLMSDISRSFYMKTGSDLGVTLRMYNAWIQPYPQGKVPCSVTINGESVGIFSAAFKKISVQDAWNIQTERPDDWYDNPDFYTEYQVNYPCVTSPLYIEVICGESMEENPLCGLETADFRIFDNGVMVGQAIDGIPSDAIPLDGAILNEGNSWTHTWTQYPLVDSNGDPITDAENNPLYADLPKTDEYGNLLYYYVEEDPVPSGYNVQYVNNGINSGTVKIVNTASDYVAIIPSTGGGGTGKYIAVGLAAVSCSAIGFLLKRRGRRRRHP